MGRSAVVGVVALVAASVGATPPQVRFVPQPGLRISGFWAERLDKLEQSWIPHCWKRLGVRGGAFQRNLAEATMLALERHPERKDLADILERFVRDDIARQQPDGYVGHCNPRYADYGRHELYGQGYFIEAAVRHMDFTRGRDRRYFDAAIRLGDHLDSVFGPPPKRTWTDGHPGVAARTDRLRMGRGRLQDARAVLAASQRRRSEPRVAAGGRLDADG